MVNKMITASEKLNKKLKDRLHICVGLDPDINKIPTHLLKYADPLFEFNKAIVEVTKDITAAYKLNFAFYEAAGIKGWKTLEKTVKLIPDDVLIIADAKRGDIGNTSEMYAKSIFEHFNFDAVTLNPYMGFDSIKPFQNYSEKISFILALTSNFTSSDFEKEILTDNSFLFQKVIKKAKEWNKFNNLGIVFGATNTEELKSNINSFDDLFVLLPGVGAQGGDLEAIVKTFPVSNNNFLINISRSLIYAGTGNDFIYAVRKKLLEYNYIVFANLNS